MLSSSPRQVGSASGAFWQLVDAGHFARTIETASL
jgi:hypothetical protein